jgi:hypothetical protein
MMNGNDLAHPVKYLHDEDFFCLGGLTKRELFAAMAMQGMFANNTQEGYWNEFAKRAVDAADALIERLNADPVAEGLNLLPMYSQELDEGLTDDN